MICWKTLLKQMATTRFECAGPPRRALLPGAIITGHVVSIWLAHRVALREYGTARRAVVATIPLAALMVIYTVVSLSVIAEPMVKFDAPAAVISR